MFSWKLKIEKNFFGEKNVKSSRNIINEKPHSELVERTSEIFYSGDLKFAFWTNINANK